MRWVAISPIDAITALVCTLTLAGAAFGIVRLLKD
jgi:hypothetical protein